MDKKGLAPILIVILIALGLGGYLYYQKQLNNLPAINKQQPTQESSSATPTPSNALNPSAPAQNTGNLKVQKVGNFSFRYPADWKFPSPEWKKGETYTDVYLISPDLDLQAPGAFLESGIRVTASDKIIKDSIIPNLYIGNVNFKSLDELESYLRSYKPEPGSYYTNYKEIQLTKVSDFDALKYTKESQGVRGPGGNKRLLIVHEDKIFELKCDFNHESTPTNASSVCETIINSVTLN